MRAFVLLAAAATATFAATPALAHRHEGQSGYRDYPGHWGGPFGNWYGGWQPQVVYGGPDGMDGPSPGWRDGEGLDREGWLRECRRRLGDNGVGGAVIGGIVGGVAGHELAGRGNRAIGTAAGAVVGAVAGSAIDKAEDRGRVEDRCSAMLDRPAPGPGAMAYAPVAYAYAVPVMLVPVTVAPPAPAPCKKTVVTETVYEYVPVRRTRHIAPRPAPDKRVRIVPDKRIAQ